MNHLAVSSIIEKGAEIGGGTTIGYFTHVLSGAHIGLSCAIGDHVHVGHGVMIGNGVEIGHSVNIHDGTIIEDGAIIGDRVSFSSIRARAQISKRPRENPHTVVEQDVIIGANVTVVGDSKIKRGSIVADGSVVIGMVYPNTFAAGNPARTIYSISSIHGQK